MTDQNQLLEELRYARDVIDQIHKAAEAHRNGVLPPTAFYQYVSVDSWTALQHLPYRGEPKNPSVRGVGQEGKQS